MKKFKYSEIWENKITFCNELKKLGLSTFHYRALLTEMDKEKFMNYFYSHFDELGRFEVLDPSFYHCLAFHENFAAVLEFDKWGYINTQGDYVILPTFDSAKSFYQSLAAVKLKNHWGYIKTNSDPLTDFIFDYADNFENGNAIVSIDFKYGLIDSKGQFIIKPEFKIVKRTHDKNLFIVITKSNKYGVLNLHGEFVYEPKYSLIYVSENQFIFE